MPPDILMQSIVNIDGVPAVQLKWGNEGGQLTPDEARMHALAVLECAEAAVHDAAMIRWLAEKMEMSKEEAFRGLVDLRVHRGDSTREDWRG